MTNLSIPNMPAYALYTPSAVQGYNNNTNITSITHLTNISDDINTIQTETKELQETNNKLVERLKKAEYSLKVKKLFEMSFFDTNTGSYSKNIQQEMDDLRKSNTEKSMVLKSFTYNNTKLSSEADTVQKTILNLPQSKLTSFNSSASVKHSEAKDLSKPASELKRRSSFVKNMNDLKILSEFFNSTIVYSINQKDNELLRNKFLLEKVMGICMYLDQRNEKHE
eukprot:CAMPEP_0170530130 /NCGR_PEP_ID=MMETSP0209-20121228/41618_1 /TAXON_ID=665100 ORGANISM="Litonotus pictus, Strain P1" /NCGR_SAMPLE_ID=MMETSP0209 /ASSEMBLY_ACC=CAM_ASM_000301 /LENGTH=223 /DNA_ID=CAMNT_0010822899 /DNA_START=70 /DNA_END=738 /DNA_ORIENTATION=+